MYGQQQLQVVIGSVMAANDIIMQSWLHWDRNSSQRNMLQITYRIRSNPWKLLRQTKIKLNRESGFKVHLICSRYKRSQKDKHRALFWERTVRSGKQRPVNVFPLNAAPRLYQYRRREYWSRQTENESVTWSAGSAGKLEESLLRYCARAISN